MSSERNDDDFVIDRGGHSPLSSNMLFAWGDCEIDESLYELRIGRAPVAIQPKSFDVLVYLVQNRERVVPKGELLARVWGGVHVTENALSQAVAGIRAALAPAASGDAIRTVRGRGYRFATTGVAKRERSDDAPPPSESSSRADRLANLVRSAVRGQRGGIALDPRSADVLGEALDRMPDVRILRSTGPYGGTPLGAWRGLLNAAANANANPSARGSRPPPIEIPSLGLADAVLDRLDALAVDKPLVLVFDRIDRADPASFLLFLHVTREPRRNTALVATVDLDAMSSRGELASAIERIAWRTSPQAYTPRVSGLYDAEGTTDG